MAKSDASEALSAAQAEFEAALAGMPSGVTERVAAGQQFNAYESMFNDEDGDPDGWEFHLSIGPISDHHSFLIIDGEWRAKLIEAALRVAMRSRNLTVSA